MNIRVQAKTIEIVAETINPIVIIGKTYTHEFDNATVSLPLFNKVISIAGHSISAINPQVYRGDKLAVYAAA